MNHAAANADAAAIFARAASVDDIRTVFVSTFVQVGRFTRREAADIRRWAVAAMVEREGEQATADWIAEVTA